MLHMRQRPQAMLNGTEQMSPSLTKRTSSPTSITSPVISWPSDWPTGAVVRPRTMCWSLPQMFVVTSLRITACGAACLMPLPSATSLGISSLG